MSRRKRMMENLDQDIRDFIERETQDNIGCGMSPEEARYAALRKFGNVTRVKEETWEVWSFVWLEQLWQDVLFGLRQLRRSPGFTAIAVVTLALGIGANTAIFSVVDAVLVRPLPFRNPAQLVWLRETQAMMGDYPLTGPDYLDWQAQSQTLKETALFDWGQSFNASGAGEPEPAYVVRTQANFFSLLGVKPQVGRTFLVGEDQPGRNHVAILSYGFWQRHFGGAGDAVGKNLRAQWRSILDRGCGAGLVSFPRPSGHLGANRHEPARSWPQRPTPISSHWTIEARRLGGGSASRTWNHRRAPREAIPRLERKSRGRGVPFEGVAGRLIPDSTPNHVCRCGASPSDRVRQRSQFIDRPRHGTLPGNCASKRSGRGSQAHLSTIIDGELASLPAWNGLWTPARFGLLASPDHSAQHAHSKRESDWFEYRSAGLYSRDRHAQWESLWGWPRRSRSRKFNSTRSSKPLRRLSLVLRENGAC